MKNKTKTPHFGQEGKIKGNERLCLMKETFQQMIGFHCSGCYYWLTSSAQLDEMGWARKVSFLRQPPLSVLTSRPKEEVTMKKEKRERDRDRQREGHGRGRGRPEVIQSHSIFEQGPAEMMKKKGTQKGSVLDFGSGCRRRQSNRILHSQFGFPCCCRLPYLSLVNRMISHRELG